MSKEHFLETETFCNKVTLFPVTLDRFNISLLNKSIHSFRKKVLTDLKLLNSSVKFN